jgi:hypothetical protein
VAFLNKRNLAIYDKRKEGLTYDRLAYVFGLSRGRVFQICKKVGKIEEVYGKDYIEAVKYGAPIPEPVDPTKPMTAVDYIKHLFPNEDHNLIVRAVHCVCRTYKLGRLWKHPGLINANLEKDYRIFLKVLDSMNLEEIMAMRNCGVKTAALLLDVQKMAREVINHGDQGSSV